MKRLKLFIHKITHWEYWPFLVVYFPAFFVWLFYAARARSLFFFLPSNPGLKNAGFLLESKKEIYDIMPGEFIPKTILINPRSPLHFIRRKMNDTGIGFPCIAKPDIGMKGLAVALLENETDVETYSEKIPVNFLIQEYISLSNEIGIFYYRIPGEEKGKISGIVNKEFLKVTGDGKSTIEDLVQSDPRHHFQLTSLQKIYGIRLQQILAKGEIRNLVPYGNHARGAKFTDVSHWADDELTTFIDDLCRKVPAFYFGRLDIRFNTLEELKQGKNFSIIELNGAGSEPTHIYDPKHSLFFAWKEIARHFNLLYSISMKNHKSGYVHMSMKEGLMMLKENRLLVNKLKIFS